jgi:hypothetical protein
LLSLLGEGDISREELNRLKAAINSASLDESEASTKSAGSQEVDEL